ncbi:protein PTHB1 [Vanessa atalanta]|uniref:protein PTHB1 n=1 Tax=Vanessa atalanta TaxID=42275 RepID=UPI001FCDFB46|nr:protein PTHB1 [Vanessa atalanta]
MSLFKVRQWWTNEKSLSEVCDEGTQNGKCIKVDRFNSHSDSDCVIVGQGSLMKIYKPNSENDNTHSILESQLNDVVLQIETGKFIADSSDRQILILHPKSYAIYMLERKTGQIDVGEQNVLSPMISHLFTRRAFSTTCGPFGYSKRDLICIQALDGTLSFFDQDTFLFMCVFNDILIPGPVYFITNSDQFIICKSTWIMEIYSYQQLGELSELSARPNRKNINIPQWIYNAGEEIISIQVIRTSSSFSSIVAVGERHLYCFQDNGLMKFMIRFDYMPICFHAYLIGWYYEPNSRLLIMVASDDSKLNIYEGTSLLWSCDLTHRPISIARCYLNALPGGIVTLSTNGIINVGFLGTEPDLNANGKPMNDFVDPDQIQDELDDVENSLQKVMNARKEFDDEDTESDQIVNIKVEIGKTNDDPISNYPPNNIDTLQTCSMVLILSCNNPNSIQSIQITYDCASPIACSDTTLCFENVNGTEIIETQVYLSSDADISDCGINIVISVVDIKGKIKIISKRVLLPLKLYCVPVENVSENNIKLSFKTNQPCLDLSEIFTEYTEEDLTRYTTVKNNLTFKYRTSNNTVTVKSNDLYTIEANDFSIMYPIFEYFVNNLKIYYVRTGVTDFKINFNLDGELIKLILHTFLKSIENHAKERIKMKSLENDLNVLQRQFTLVQKRLLVQYGSLPPGNCDGLEFLMNDTHERIKTVAYGIMQSKRYVFSAGNILRRIGSIIIYILKEKLNDEFKVKLVEEMLSLHTLNDQFQEWEENVAQGLSYILNKVFKKTEKDKEKLAPVTDQDILSQTNLKKFLKQMRIVFENLLTDCQDNNEVKSNVIRTEEFVEVI